MITSLTNELQSRKGKLLAYLNTNGENLTLERQHQIYGAINEIEGIIEIISQHRNKEIEMEQQPDEVFLLKPIQDKGFVSGLKEKLKDLF